MKITKEEIFDIIKKNNLNEEQAEQFLELVGKGVGGAIVDIAVLAASRVENETVKTILSMVVLPLEAKAREAIKELEINL